MKAPEILETKRLILKPYSKEDVKDILNPYIVFEEGFSLTIVSKERAEPCGLCSLQTIDGNEVRCLYVLLPECRSNGYAIEAMLKLIEYAFTESKIPKIVAYIHPNNTPGWKVAERIGMKYMGQIKHNDFNPYAMLFTIDREEYVIQHSY
ncbi:MAG: GNAT family N-acetyltransferase [Promethearchaeota archaeon]|jgi:RimJ/RimL family protein N-acetyltransferase